MGTKQSLDKAKKIKDDEFFTLYDDIANEVLLCKEQLKGKRILCPCDWDESYSEEIVYKEEEVVGSSNLFDAGGTVKHINIKASKRKLEKNLDAIKCNFVKFLVAHAETYKIKSISVSGYNPSNGKGVRFQDIDYSKYDLVITNPPFSLFREFIDIMFDNKMQFLVIGPQTAITYKESFKYILNNEMWLGYHHHLTGFILPDGTILKKNDALPRCCCWFTNLDVSYRHDKLILTEKYNPTKYPNYYNYKGIDVAKTKQIPCDYEGQMGVPTTFLQKFNPEQFKILGLGKYIKKLDNSNHLRNGNCLWIAKNGKPDRMPFERILIKNKEVVKNDE